MRLYDVGRLRAEEEDQDEDADGGPDNDDSDGSDDEMGDEGMFVRSSFQFIISLELKFQYSFFFFRWREFVRFSQWYNI